MKYLAGFLSALVVLAALVVVVAYTGAYNVAATQPHSSVGRWLLMTAMYNSVQARADADAATPPEARPAPSAGFEAYRSMCVHCHGAPGVESAEWAQVMRPAPPELSDVATGWSEQELYWILQHGIRMSGMPAFGPTHSEDELWELVAFVDGLPELSAQEYRQLERQAGAGGQGG